MAHQSILLRPTTKKDTTRSSTTWMSYEIAPICLLSRDHINHLRFSFFLLGFGERSKAWPGPGYIMPEPRKPNEGQDKRVNPFIDPPPNIRVWDPYMITCSQGNDHTKRTSERKRRESHHCKLCNAMLFQSFGRCSPCSLKIWISVHTLSANSPKLPSCTLQIQNWSNAGSAMYAVPHSSLIASIRDPASWSTATQFTQRQRPFNARTRGLSVGEKLDKLYTFVSENKIRRSIVIRVSWGKQNDRKAER